MEISQSKGDLKCHNKISHVKLKYKYFKVVKYMGHISNKKYIRMQEGAPDCCEGDQGQDHSTER